MSSLTTVDHDLAQSLGDCSLSGRSGMITAVRGKLKRIFCVQEGRLTYAVSNVIEEQLSETLVRDEVLASGDIAAAMTQASTQGVRLSRLLVEEKIVDAAQMDSALEQHIRHLLFITLDWPDGESSFHTGQPDLGDEVTIALPCPPLLIEYARHHPASLDQVRIRVGPPNMRPVLVEPRRDLLEGAELSEVETYFLECCNGSVSLGDVIGGSPAPEEPTWRAMYGLILLGVLQPETAAASPTQAKGLISRDEVMARLEKAKGADYYAVLELNHTCVAEQIRSAYYFLARRYHPDRFRTGKLEDLRGRIESYFTQVTEAYNTLTDPRQRAEYDEQRADGRTEESEQNAAYLAKQNFLRAKMLIGRGRFNDAVTSLENAITLDGQQATYHLELGCLLSRNPRMRRKAEEHLVLTNRIDPALVDGYVALGQLYLKTRRNDDAIRMFEEVLRWEAGHLEASAQLKALGKRTG